MPLYEDQVAIFQRRELKRFTGAGARIEVELRDRAPVRTGELRRSIRVDRQAQGFLWRFVITVAAPQGKYTDEGTGVFGPHGTPITPVAAKVLAWLGPDNVWIRAKQVAGQPGTQWFSDTVKTWISYLRSN